MDEREQNSDDKTEEATEERRRQFREEGKIAGSKELLSAFSLIVFTAAAYFFGQNFVASLSSTFNSSWALIPQIVKNPSSIQNDLFASFRPILPIFLVSGALMLFLPTSLGLVLSQFNWSWKKVEFNFEKLNPINGIKNIYGQNLIVETVKSILKSVLILGVAYFFIKDSLFESLDYMNADLHVGLAMVGRATMQLLLFVCIATFVIGAADYAWNLYKVESELKMTKEQVKNEIKSQEGDPLIKSMRRRFGREVLMKASIDKVPQATFVVTNPTHYSVAVRYASGMPAPIVVSKGQDYLALKIRQIAKQNDIIIIENKPLARALYKTVEIGEEVPASLYTAVIEVMKAIYGMRGRSYFAKYGIATQFQ